MICNDWIVYVQQILNNAGHGYVSYCPIVIPTEKKDKAVAIDAKLNEKYITNISKDVRYRRKKKGLANCIYIRWDIHAVILRSSGEWLNEDPGDRFYSFHHVPYVFPAGNWIYVKVGPAKTGKKFTAYLNKESYRNIKEVLRENIEHRRLDVLDKYYGRLAGLPAYSGILSQMGELRRFCMGELRRHGINGYRPARLTLRNVF